MDDVNILIFDKDLCKLNRLINQKKGKNVYYLSWIDRIKDNYLNDDFFVIAAAHGGSMNTAS